MRNLKYMMVAAITMALLTPHPADAQVLDYLTGRKPILKVYSPPQDENRVEVRKPDSVGSEVLSPLNVFYPRQVIVDYKKETRYVTKWVKVPTTLYRPSLELGAQPGQSVLLKPVETYTWQLRQVPVENYRPVLEPSNNNLMSRVHIPRLGDILEPILPRCSDLPASTPARKDSSYYDKQQENSGDDTLKNVEPADTRPQLDADALKQPETGEGERTEVRKVETPSDKQDDESVLKKPNVNPESSDKEGTEKEEEKLETDPDAPLADPDAEKDQETGEAPRLINPLDKTARDTVPMIGPRLVIPASVTTPPRITVLDDEDWIPVK